MVPVGGLRLLIVDDEPLARLRLRTLLGDLAARDGFQTQVVGEAGDADAAWAALQAAPVDALLLDIRVPGLGAGHGGLRLAALLRSRPHPPQVIFVTAHADHALKAFELEAADYLTKPVRRERLLAALQRVRPRQAPAATAAPPEPPALVINDRGRVLRLPLDEVLLLKAGQKTVTLRTAAHAHVLDESLSELEQRLSALGGAFIRIHRNALVARNAIRALELRGEDGEGWAVRVAPLDEWLAVSRRQVAAVRAALAPPAPPAPPSPP
jgi:two-component system response regulator AlgR